MRDILLTQHFYERHLDFITSGIYPDYLILQKDQIRIDFFLYKDLNPLENDGQVYFLVNDIHALYFTIQQSHFLEIRMSLRSQPWGKNEFSIIDPDHNLLTFGQDI